MTEGQNKNLETQLWSIDLDLFKNYLYAYSLCLFVAAE